MLLQAKEKEAQKQQDMTQEQDDNFTEMANHIHGDLLTENPDVAQSAFGPHRSAECTKYFYTNIP